MVTMEDAGIGFVVAAVEIVGTSAKIHCAAAW